MSGLPSAPILVTGGAGFVGANLAIALAERHGREVIAFDNLKRRGSELNLPRLAEAGVRFVHGDVREPSDLEPLPPVEAIVECSAEPSALAGLDGGTAGVVHPNLFGAYHCLEFARRHAAHLVFLSTSRVYPVAPLNGLHMHETETRFELAERQPVAGASRAGISELFPLDGARTLYGATKLASELLIAEYVESFGLLAVVNRCGVLAGPWQMGKVDQGVFAFWVLSHYFGRDLAYIGYGGEGKQVRDLLHVDDLIDLIQDQLARPAHWSGLTVNVGGGREFSLSLLETTAICEELTGNRVAIDHVADTRPGDVPVYLSDCERLHRHTDWRPTRSPREVLEDIFTWVDANEGAVVGAVE